MTPSYHITIVTCGAFMQLSDDDQLLQQALTGKGLKIRIANWRDPSVRWEDSTLTLIRSPWDYFEYADEFAAWIDRVAAVTRLRNPAPALHWNRHKRYLAELAQKGCPVTPTLFVDTKQSFELAAACAAQGWHEIVVKPCVSGGAFRTQRFRLDDSEQALAAQSHLDGLTATRDAMIQPYQSAVETEWERSLIYFNGNFSHALRKPPFSSGGEGLEQAHQASAQEMAVARQVLAVLPEMPVYARVDMIPAQGELLLMELELIEPALFFRFCPDRGEHFADILLALLAQG